MADEINYSLSIQFDKGNISIKREAQRQSVSVAGDAYSAQVQSIPTTAGGTAVAIASAVGTKGYAFFRNLDATNFVTLGVHDGSANYFAFAKLKPGEAGMIRLASSTIYALADTGAVLLEAIIIED